MRFTLTFFCIIAIGSFPLDSFAQVRVNNYSMTTPMLNFTDISNTGTLLTKEATGYGWRNEYFTITLPFDFPYDNSTVTSGTLLYLSSATIGFGSKAPFEYGTNYGGLTSSTYPARLFPFGAYYCSMGGGTNAGDSTWGCGIYYELTGTAPFRTFTIQMNGVHSEDAGHNDGYVAEDIQVKLFETTGVIQFLYKNHSQTINPEDNAGGGAIGLNGFNTPTFVDNVYETGLKATPATDLQWSPSTNSVADDIANAGFAIGDCYPNPASGDVFIPITLAAEGSPRIELCDASGAVARTVILGEMSTGEHIIAFNTEGISSGTYFCSMVCNDVRVSRRLSIVR